MRDKQDAVDAGRMLDLIQHVSSIVASNRDLDTMLQSTVTLVRAMLDIDRCSVLLLDDSDGSFLMRAAAAIPESEWSSVRVRPGEGIAGAAIARRKPQLVPNILESEFAVMANTQRYASGSFINVPLIVHSQVIGVINASGRADGRVFAAFDLQLLSGLSGLLALAIENARLLQALEADRQKLKTLVDNLPQAVCTLTPNEVITDTNDRLLRFLQLPGDKASAGRSIRGLFPNRLVTAVAELKSEVLASGAARFREIELDLAPGDMTPVEVVLAPLAGNDGQAEGLLLSLSDLSMRNEIRELRRLDDMKSNFLCMVSHELRTPLTAIKGAVHILRNRQIPEAANLAECPITGIVHTNTERLIRLVNDLLDMVYLENSDLALIKQPESLHELLQGCIDAYQPNADAKRITMHIDLNEMWVMGDRNRLHQALCHIIDNAIKFTPRSGHVWITLQRNGASGTITVRDSGCGISPDAKMRLFTKFFQAQDPLTRSCGGAGIGLYMAKSLVELHGGHVIAGPPSSHGAEFVIELPLLERQFVPGAAAV